MTNVFTNIEACLNTRLSQLAGLPPVQWPNVDFMPTEGQTFLRPTLMPAAGKLSTVAGSYIETGLYQIDIFTPLNQGSYELTSLQDEIFNLYAGNKTITSNSVTVFVQDIVQGKGVREDGWYLGYITVYYQCYT